ncbi:MAG: glycine zipper 2TM domain-containing protein [Planctomycetes bacterium]|nr:glycine zipper 2TM domain-containing protein [Planctomycetota bacterium]
MTSTKPASTRITRLSWTYLFLGFVILTSGCVSTSGGSERYTEMVVKAEWVDGVPEFVSERPGGEDRVISLQVRNPSGIDLDTRRLRALLAARVEEDGWRVTRDPGEALYDLTAVVKFWGRNENLPNDSSKMGQLVGGLAGAAIARNQTKNNSDSTRENATIAGAVIGSALGELMDRKTRSEAYTMIIETRIDETVGGTVSKELDDQSRRGGGTATASIHGDNTVAAGGAVTRSKVKQSYESLSNTVRIKNTLVITARQRALTEEMALPAIEQRLERIIPEILP